MQHTQDAQAVNDPMDEKAQRYSEGLAKLGQLRALHRSLNGQQLENGGIAINENSFSGNVVVPKKTSLEITLLEKGRSRALEEYNDHQIKTEAFMTLAGRYRALGLETQANAYNERGHLENAATKGFQAVLDAYDRKLDGLGVANAPEQAPKNLNMTYRSLQSAERFLEGYTSDISICCAHTLEVLKAEELLQKLETDQAARQLTPDEQKRFETAMSQRDRFVRMAEREALNAAISFKHFQKEIQSAEKSYDAFSRALTGNHSPEHSQDPQDPSPIGSESRMNRLAVGMVVCQTLKILDREL
ncbi:MAG: hypothetical protein JXA73_03100 [Acidobacteria bacterium]|nr:hypothetical protein [Acidobacteriota bacterium]